MADPSLRATEGELVALRNDVADAERRLRDARELVRPAAGELFKQTAERLRHDVAAGGTDAEQTALVGDLVGRETSSFEQELSTLAAPIGGVYVVYLTVRRIEHLRSVLRDRGFVVAEAEPDEATPLTSALDDAQAAAELLEDKRDALRMRELSGHPATRRAWCYFRNLVHATYRAARWIGAAGDPDAKLVVTDGSSAATVARVAAVRDRLAGTVLLDSVAAETTTAAIEQPYRDLTGLDLESLETLFRQPGWAKYYGSGGWAVITAATIALRAALDADDAPAAEAVCDRVATMRHHGGGLVTRHPDQKPRPVWPVHCD